MLSLPAGARAGERVALILAGEDYQSFKPSAIGVDRAKKLSEALSGHGFDVMLEANPNNAGARASLREFASRAKGADAALVFLIGHGAASGGRTFFLPANAEIRRATDLLSRGLTVDSVAQIVGGAKRGAVIFFMTVADISSTLDGVAARAQAGMQPADNVTVVYSSSDKVPVSSVNSVSVRAAADAIEVMAEEEPKLSVLIDAASAGGVGIVTGSTADLDLAKPSEPDPAAQSAQAEDAAAAEAAAARQAAEQEAAARAAAQSEAQTAAEEAARKEAEARAREAESRAIAAEERAREAEQRAKAEAERARKAAAERAAERERAAAADAEAQAAKQAAAVAEAEAKAAAAKQAEEARASAEAEPPPSGGSDVASLQVVEALLGRAQRRQIQRELKQLDLYAGPIDSIFGPQTREAIKLFQRNNEAEETGYLTPEQFQKLVGG